MRFVSCWFGLLKVNNNGEIATRITQQLISCCAKRDSLKKFFELYKPGPIDNFALCVPTGVAGCVGVLKKEN